MESRDTVRMALQAYEVRGCAPHILDDCQRLLQPVFEQFPGEFEWESLLLRCQQGLAQLWVLGEKDSPPFVACMVTRVLTLPEKKVVELVAFGSTNFRASSDYYDLIESWAASQGCSEIEARARPGFEPALRKLGFEKKYVVLRKSVRNPRLNG